MYLKTEDDSMEIRTGEFLIKTGDKLKRLRDIIHEMGIENIQREYRKERARAG